MAKKSMTLDKVKKSKWNSSPTVAEALVLKPKLPLQDGEGLTQCL